jgi:hypothetical protein
MEKGDELNVELYLAGRFIKEKIKTKLTYDQKNTITRKN